MQKYFPVQGTLVSKVNFEGNRRIVRSLTSGENLFDLFMTPFSQDLEPPQNPGRFNKILDRAGLEAASCECYRMEKILYERILG